MEEISIIEAAFEAIFWWNHGEAQYHRYFKNIDLITADANLCAFFTSRVFEPFLKEYSIRRNIPATYKGVDDLLKTLVESSFFDAVKKGQVDIIDSMSSELKQLGLTKRETKSLLSKIAFLTNPDQFTLYDTFAKKSLHSFLNRMEKSTTIQNLGNYSNFIHEITILKNHLISTNKFEAAFAVLEKFSGTEAHTFFITNHDAFHLRIIDKMLWLKEQQERISKGAARQVSNESYIMLFKIHNNSLY